MRPAKIAKQRRAHRAVVILEMQRPDLRQEDVIEMSLSGKLMRLDLEEHPDARSIGPLRDRDLPNLVDIGIVEEDARGRNC